MRNYLLAATAAAAAFIATPAMATNDGSGYIGIEGGVLFPQKQDVFGTLLFTNAVPPDVVRTTVGTLDYNTGYDVDLIGGYDLGMFRLEGELGYKRASNKNFTTSSTFVTAINSGAGTAYTTTTNFGLNNHLDIYSAMLNALVDFGGNGSFGGYAGGGVGYADVHQFGASQGKLAWQLIAGAYAPISSNIDIGLKYRYFQTSNMSFVNDYPFAAATVTCGANPCSPGVATFDTNRHITSHSLLASLVFNFGGVAAPPPPPPPPAAASSGSSGDPDLRGRLGDPGDVGMSGSAATAPAAAGPRSSAESAASKASDSTNRDEKIPGEATASPGISFAPGQVVNRASFRCSSATTTRRSNNASRRPRRPVEPKRRAPRTDAHACKQEYR